MDQKKLFQWFIAFVIVLSLFKWRGLVLFLIVFLFYLAAQTLRKYAAGESAKVQIINKNQTKQYNLSSMLTKLKVSPKHIIYLVVGLVALLIIVDGLVSVPAGHVAVLYDRGRGVLHESLTEGLHLKIPFWQIATKMDTRLQTFTMTIREEEQKGISAEPVESLTRDGQKVNIDATVQFRIAGKDAPKIYQSIGLDYVEKIVKPGVRSVIREVITGYDSTKLFNQENRTEAALKMEEKLRNVYIRSNIQLDSLLLRNVQFSDTYLKAIEDKQVAQQKIQKAEYEKQEAEQLKQKKIIEAEGEAQAIKLKAETLRFNPQVIQWEFVEKMAPNINWGILPDGALPLLDLKQLMPK